MCVCVYDVCVCVCIYLVPRRGGRGYNTMAVEAPSIWCVCIDVAYVYVCMCV
jgi:hypothetical protein